MLIGGTGALLLGLPALATTPFSSRKATLLGWLAIACGVAQMLVFLSPLAYSFSSPSIFAHRFWRTATGAPVFWLPPVLLGAVAVIAVRVSKSRQRLVTDHPRCEKCGYILRRLVEPRCPECGRQFDPLLLGIERCNRDSTTPVLNESRDSKQNLHRGRHGRLIVGLLLVVALGTVVLIQYLNKPIPFDSGQWHSGTRQERERMLDDIVKSKILMARTHKEVVDLLGAPDREVLAYNVGQERYRFSIYLDHESETLTFAGFFLSDCPRPIAFDRETWLSASSEDRWPMAVTLRTDKRLLDGKNRNEIIELLGLPDDEDSMKYNCGGSKNKLIVRLKNGRVFHVVHLQL